MLCTLEMSSCRFLQFWLYNTNITVVIVVSSCINGNYDKLACLISPTHLTSLVGVLVTTLSHPYSFLHLMILYIPFLRSNCQGYKWYSSVIVIIITSRSSRNTRIKKVMILYFQFETRHWRCSQATEWWIKRKQLNQNSEVRDFMQLLAHSHY